MSIVTEKSVVKISRHLMLMMTVADANQNGYVEYDECEKVLRSNNDGSGGVMEDVFKAMDDDGDGKVGYEDLRNYLLLAGFEVNDNEIKAMIRLGGVDDDAEKKIRVSSLSSLFISPFFVEHTQITHISL